MENEKSLRVLTVFIIGANGKMGKALIAELRRFGAITIGSTRQEEDTDADYTLRAPDLNKEGNESLNRQLEKLLFEKGLRLTCIIELAGAGWKDSELTEEKWLELTSLNVDMPAYWAKAWPNVHHVLFSSCAVYGKKGTKELTIYSGSKRLAETAMVLYCKGHLSFVRPTKIDTKFAERAGLSDVDTKGFPSVSDVAEAVVQKAILLDKELVLPGWQAKMVHFFHVLSPYLAQLFLS